MALLACQSYSVSGRASVEALDAANIGNYTPLTNLIGKEVSFHPRAVSFSLLHRLFDAHFIQRK